MKLFNVTLVAVGAALIAVLSPFTLPLGPVPLTLQTLAIGLVATIFKARETFFAVLLYILLGLIGLPVFQGGTAGLTELLSPRGGFLAGFLLSGTLISFILVKVRHKALPTLLVNILGHFLILAIGSVWLKFFLSTDWLKAFTLAFVPFILAEVIKASLATAVGLPLHKILSKQNSYFR